MSSLLSWLAIATVWYYIVGLTLSLYLLRYKPVRASLRSLYTMDGTKKIQQLTVPLLLPLLAPIAFHSIVVAAKAE